MHYGNSLGSTNFGLGFEAGSALTSGDNNIDIGNVGLSDEANRFAFGTEGTQQATFVAGISGATVPGSAGVIIDPDGILEQSFPPSVSRMKSSRWTKRAKRSSYSSR